MKRFVLALLFSYQLENHFKYKNIFKVISSHLGKQTDGLNMGEDNAFVEDPIQIDFTSDGFLVGESASQ